MSAGRPYFASFSSGARWKSHTRKPTSRSANAPTKPSTPRTSRPRHVTAPRSHREAHGERSVGIVAVGIEPVDAERERLALDAQHETPVDLEIGLVRARALAGQTEV